MTCLIGGGIEKGSRRMGRTGLGAAGPSASQCPSPKSPSPRVPTNWKTTMMGEGQALLSGSLVMQLLTQREERLLTWGGQASKELDPPPFSQETEAMGAGHPSNDRCALPSTHVPGLGRTRGTRDLVHRQGQSTGQWLRPLFTLAHTHDGPAIHHSSGLWPLCQRETQ